MKTIHLSISALAALMLVACGGSSDDDNQTGGPNPVATSVNARADTAVAMNGFAVDIDVTSNDTYSNADALQIDIVEFNDSHGQLEVNDLMVTFTPAAGFWGETSFIYKLSEGASSDQAEVTVTSAQQLTISGQIAGVAVPNAKVSIEYLEQEFATNADADGNYQIEMLFAADASEQLLRLRAKGLAENDQGHVTLSSIIGDFSQLKSAAGEDFVLTRENSQAVQLTPLSTAHDILAQAGARGELNAANLAQVQVTVSADLMVEMAAVIKLLISHPDYPLADNFATIESLLKDPYAYNDVVRSALQRWELDTTINSIFEDTSLAPQLTASQLVGDYLQDIRGSDVMGFHSGESWRFYANGTMDMSNKSIGFPLYSVIQQTWAIEDNLLQLGSHSRVATYPMFPSQLSSALYDMGYEHIDELANYLYQRDGRYILTHRTEYHDVRVLAQHASGFYLTYMQARVFAGFEFEYEGQRYTMPDVKFSEERRNRQLVSYASIKHDDGRFEINQSVPWVLPIIATSVKDHETLASSDFVHFNLDSASSGTFYGELSNVHGQWTLSDDATTLSLSYALGAQEITTTLEVASFGGMKSSAIVQHQVTGTGHIRVDFDSLIYLRRVAPYTPQSNQLLTHKDDEFFARFIVQSAEIWPGGVPSNESLGLNWHLGSSGAVRAVRRYCGERLALQSQSCADEPTYFQLGRDTGQSTWVFNGGEALDYNQNSWPPRTLATYIALDYDEATQAMNVVDYRPNYSSAGTDLNQPLLMWPRVKVWVRISDIDFLTGNETQEQTASYRVIYPTQ